MKKVPTAAQNAPVVSIRLALLLSLALSGIWTSARAAQSRIAIDIPRGGEYYIVGQQQIVSIVTHIKNVKVELSRDGGQTFETLGTVNALNRDLLKRANLNWTVTGPASNTCLIRASGGAFSATSGMFMIVAVPPGATGSINTAQLADNAVTTPKIADAAVTTQKVADLSITAAKINSGAASSQMVLLADGLGGAAWGNLNAPTFDQLGSGTNTTAAFVVGSGASIGVAGTGTVTANQFNGILPVVNGGSGASTLLGLVVGNGTSPEIALKVNLNATRLPLATDDATQGYAIGSRWICTPANDEFLCTDPTAGAAVWKKTTPTESNNDSGTSTGYDLKLTSASPKQFLRMTYDRQTNTLFAGTQATTVLKINPDTGAYTTINITPTPTRDVASLTSDGTYVYVSTTDYTNPANVYKIDIATGTIINMWTIASAYPPAMAVVGGFVYLVSYDLPAKLYKLDPNSGAQTNYTLSMSAGYTLVFDGTYLWSSSDDGSGKVGRFNVATSTADPTAYLNVGDFLDGLVYDSIDNCLWTVELNNRALVKFSTSGAILGTFPVSGGQGYNVAFDGTYLWSSLGTGTIVKSNTAAPSNLVSYHIASAGPCRASAVCDSSFWIADDNTPGTLYRFPLNSTPVDYHIASETLTTAPTNTVPSLLIDPSVPPTFVSAAGGTYFGVSGASNFTGNLADLQLNGTSIFKVSKNSVTLGGKLNVPTGAAGIAGNATLSAGSVTVTTSACTASSVVICTYTTAGGTQGYLRVTAGNGSFTITSSSATDTSHVNWWVVN